MDFIQKDSVAKRFSVLKNLEPQQEACEDFFQGADKVLEHNKYIIQLTRESQEQYTKRVNLTPFLNMFSPILNGVVGLIMKQEPVIPNSNIFDFEDVDSKNTDFSAFSEEICREMILFGMCFVSIESDGERVYLKKHSYKNLWSFKQNDTNTKITNYVFREQFYKSAEEGFGRELKERFLEYGENYGRVWIKEKNSNDFIIAEEWQNPLQTPAVVPFNAGVERETLVASPKFYDLAVLNARLLNLQSQLAYVLSIVANPVLLFFGLNSQGTNNKITLSSSQAINFQTRQNQGAEYCEPSGSGVALLQAEIQEIKEDINKTSFNLLKHSVNNTKIDAAGNQIKTNTYISSVAQELEQQANKCLEFTLQIQNKSFVETDYIRFKKNFDDVLYSKEQLDLLHNLNKEGALSTETLLQSLKSYNILREDFDVEAELERLS